MVPQPEDNNGQATQMEKPQTNSIQNYFDNFNFSLAKHGLPGENQKQNIQNATQMVKEINCNQEGSSRVQGQVTQGSRDDKRSDEPDQDQITTESED